MWGLLGLLFTTPVLVAISTVASASTLPLNNLHLEDNPKVFYRVSSADFHRIIQKVTREFSPVVRAHGAKLEIVGDWNGSQVNAFAIRSASNVWTVQMYGGLARRKEMTPDGFALVVCHELGHHLGGYPFKWSLESENYWASSEGQADYFASQVCARRIWKNEREINARHRSTVPAFAKRVCDRNLREQVERDLCYRTAEAGLSLARLMNRLQENRRQVAFEKFSRERVSETNTKHTSAQCRLDTYLNGASCGRSYNLERIPGSDLRIMNASDLDQEKEAALSSCEDYGDPMDGSRPACWFRPLLKNW